MNLQKEFYDKIKSDKYKITRWNENLIEMSVILSFLTIDVKRSTEHLGISYGWTKLVNDEHKLIIGGGIINGVEYLQDLQFGTNLNNPWNNFVNPFYLFDIITDEGKSFFYNYYKDEIKSIYDTKISDVKILSNKLKEAKRIKKEMLEEINRLKSLNKSKL